MAYTPDAAIARASELTSGAWSLYVLLCRHRNQLTGRCDPANTTLQREMGCSYTHVSDCKTELARKGWILRRGRGQVDLLVGRFPSPRALSTSAAGSGISEQQVRAHPKIEHAKSAEMRPPVSENSEPRKLSPISDEPEKILSAAAAVTEEQVTPDGQSDLANHTGVQASEEHELRSAASSSAPPRARTGGRQKRSAAQLTSFSKQPCDDEFVARVKASQVFPQVDVENVWRKLKLHCSLEGVQPEKGRFLHWLKTEREVPANTVSAAVAKRTHQSSSVGKLVPGLETMAPDELAREQEIYEEARKEMEQWQRA